MLEPVGPVAPVLPRERSMLEPVGPVDPQPVRRGGFLAFIMCILMDGTDAIQRFTDRRRQWIGTKLCFPSCLTHAPSYSRGGTCTTLPTPNRVCSDASNHAKEWRSRGTNS